MVAGEYSGWKLKNILFLELTAMLPGGMGNSATTSRSLLLITGFMSAKNDCLGNLLPKPNLVIAK